VDGLKLEPPLPCYFRLGMSRAYSVATARVFMVTIVLCRKCLPHFSEILKFSNALNPVGSLELDKIYQRLQT